MADETTTPISESESPQASLPPQPEVAPQPTAEPESIPPTILRIQKAFVTTRDYANLAIEDVIKPSIKTFLETCDTNPRVAAIVATPALLAFFVVATFLVLSASALILYSILTISVGVLVVIVGGIISLTFKLVVVLLATLPMAGMATGLLVGANTASIFIIDKLPEGSSENLNVSKFLKEIDWQSIVDGTASMGKYTVQAAKEAGPALVVIRNGLYILGAATQSAFAIARAALHHAQTQTGAQSSIDTVAAPTTTTSGVEPVTTESAPTTPAAPVEGAPALEEDSDDGQHYVSLVEAGPPILIDTREESPEKLRRRVGYSPPGDDHETDEMGGAK